MWIIGDQGTVAGACSGGGSGGNASSSIRSDEVSTFQPFPTKKTLVSQGATKWILPTCGPKIAKVQRLQLEWPEPGAEVALGLQPEMTK